MREMPIAARLYVAAVIAAGAAMVVYGVRHLVADDWPTVLALSALMAVGEMLSTALARSVANNEVVKISVALPITVASVLLLGPVGAPVVGAFMAVAPLRTAWFKRAFNGAMCALSAFVAGVVYLAAHGELLVRGTDIGLTNVLVPMVAATLTFEIVNGLLMVMVIALVERVSPWRVWVGTMAESAMPLFIYSTFGLLLAVVWPYVGFFAAVLVLAPLLVARWVFAMFSARQAAYDATIRSLIKAVETKDYYTRGHSERVSRASVLIGRRSGMREDRVSSLRYAGMLHDVGKLGVPTSVLQKSGRLTEDEFEAIQQHPARGREITKELEFLGEAIEGIHLHHERIDGRGYPLGLKGAEIPEFARIIAVADAFDSMTTTRSYRGARSIDDAVVELRACKGSQFDPVMVEALVAALESDGWNVADTVPDDLPEPLESRPSFGSDDDDPTAAAELGILGPQGAAAIPDDVSELDSDLVTGQPEDRP
jgi:HD-GYP domain-containing protein (c-di-GMP phosphodiesterase class II)